MNVDRSSASCPSIRAAAQKAPSCGGNPGCATGPESRVSADFGPAVRDD
jgi:hypothetical protein